MQTHVVKLVSLCGALLAMAIILLPGNSPSAGARQASGTPVSSATPIRIPIIPIIQIANLQCRYFAGFSDNASPTVGFDFPAVPFPPDSVGYADAPQFDTEFRYADIHVCVYSNDVDTAAIDKARASFTSSLLAQQWLTSLNYPLASKVDSPCLPDHHCFKKDDGHGEGFVDVWDIHAFKKITAGSLVFLTVRAARSLSQVPRPPLWFRILGEWSSIGIPIVTFVVGIALGAFARLRGAMSWLSGKLPRSRNQGGAPRRGFGGP